ncbi:MAG: hypothetical protein ACU84Q_15950 [Gammaproteobacteria bacterium]
MTGRNIDGPSTDAIQSAKSRIFNISRVHELFSIDSLVKRVCHRTSRAALAGGVLLRNGQRYPGANERFDARGMLAARSHLSKRQYLWDDDDPTANANLTWLLILSDHAGMNTGAFENQQNYRCRAIEWALTGADRKRR